MTKFSALALAAALGLSTFAPLSADAATTKKPVHHTAKKTELVCHMVKEKDGKMHKLCHHHHVKAKKKMKADHDKKTMKKK